MWRTGYEHVVNTSPSSGGSIRRSTGHKHATTPVEGEGAAGDEPGYNPTPEDLRLWEVYGEWVHASPVTHLDGGILDDPAWQAWWHDR